MASDARKIAFENLPGARVLASGLTFLESPRFSQGEIFYSDGTAVRATDLLGHTRTVAELPTQMCLGVHIGDGGAVYASAPHERHIYRITDQGATLVVDLSAVSDSPINEFVVLPNGKFLVESMGFDLLAGETPRAARMILVPPDGSTHETGPEMLFANGLALCDGGRTLWVVESGSRRINRLSLDLDGEVTDCVPIELKGSNPTSRRAKLVQRARLLSYDRVRGPGSAVTRVMTPIIRMINRAPVVQGLMMRVLPFVMRHAPDGLAVAADGSLWYADMMQGAVIRVGADGVATAIVKVNKRHVSSCAIFEAEDQEWLAITAADVVSVAGAPEKKTAALLAVPINSVLAAVSPS